MSKITGAVEPGMELDKRAYFPGVVVHSDCPKCGKSFAMDLGKDYLSYPMVGPADIDFCCYQDGGCDEEWTVPVTIGLTVTLRKTAVRR